MAPDDEKKSGNRGNDGGRSAGGERPDYKVYKSRPGFLSRLRGRSIGDLRKKSGPKAERGEGSRPAVPGRQPAPGRKGVPGRERLPGDEPYRKIPSRKPPGRRIVKWVAILVGVWLLISFAAFAVSAQLQSWKLAGDARSALSGGGFMVASPQNILVIGTDARDPDTLEPGAATSPECYREQARGETPSAGCVGTARADTLMVVRAGGGTFRQLSIPRDTYAEIPGNGSQKINAAYAFGGASLQVETVEQFLGIELSHVVILDFNGFVDLIDALGGITVDVPERTCGDISGGVENGGWTIRLRRGDNTLNGEEALAYARLRSPSPCPAPGPSAYTTGYSDFDRAAAQQRVIDGIKSRLTSPLRLPQNFVRGPWIGWAAPRAFVSDMGALSMPQLALSTAIAGGGGATEVLCASDPSPCGLGPGGSIDVPQSERERAVRALVNG